MLTPFPPPPSPSILLGPCESQGHIPHPRCGILPTEQAWLQNPRGSTGPSVPPPQPLGPSLYSILRAHMQVGSSGPQFPYMYVGRASTGLGPGEGSRPDLGDGIKGPGALPVFLSPWSLSPHLSTISLFPCLCVFVPPCLSLLSLAFSTCTLIQGFLASGPVRNKMFVV